MKKKEPKFEIPKDFLNDYHIYNSLALEVVINYIKSLKAFYVNLLNSNNNLYSDDYIKGFIDGLNENIRALEVFKAREENKFDS